MAEIAKAFVHKMKVRDMRVPIKEDFKVDDLKFDAETMTDIIIDDGHLQLEFVLDAIMVFYEFKDEAKLEYFAKQLDQKPLNSLDGDKPTRLKILTTVASYFLEKAIRETDEKLRDDLFREVRLYFTKSDKIEISEKSTFTLKGFYFLFENEPKQSADYFDNAKETDPNFIPCIVGRACLEFARKRYVEARDLLKMALRKNPNGPYQIRLALSLCYYQLEEFELAEIGFRSVLSRSPNCVEAHIGLAVIARRNNKVENYYSKLTEVFRLSPYNYLTNIYLAEHYFYKGELERAKKLATFGLQAIDKQILVSKADKRRSGTRVDMCCVKSKYLYMLGFIAHESEEKLDNAFKYYKAAVDCHSDNVSALFGLAQVHLAGKNLLECIQCFETIISLKSEYECSDCFRIMAYVYSKLGKRTAAKKYYDLALKYHPHDEELLIEYATYLESVDNKEALAIYARIISLATTTPDLKLKAELYNNYAVTLLKNKKYEEAEQYLDKASKELKEQDLTLSYFIKFNRGILYEEQAKYEKAIEEYKSLVKVVSGLLDPILRLAQIYYDKGDFNSAIELCDMASKTVVYASKINRVDVPLCLKANFLLDSGETEQCLQVINSLEKLQPGVDDPYALLLKAKCMYLKSVTLRNDTTEQKKCFKEAAECCRTILKKKEEEHNMYAGMTIAAVFGERGRIKDCNDILNTCQEANPSNTHVLYNLALIEYIKQHHEKSLTILVNYMQKHPEEFNDQVKTLFAINNLILKNYKDALRQFQKMVLMYPDRYTFIYNFATFMHEYVKAVFRLNKRDKVQIENCKKYIKNSRRILEALFRKVSTKVDNTYSYPQAWSDQKKKRALTSFQMLQRGIHNNLFFMKENDEKYKENIKNDLKQFEEENITREQRKRIIDEHAYSKIRNEELEERRKQEEHEEMERRAELDRKIANELAESLKLSKLQEPKKKKKTTKNGKDYADEHGAHLNFATGVEDQEKTFTDIQNAGPRFNPPRKATKKENSGTALVGEKKRLKKKMNVEKEDVESDELLDLAPISDEESEKEEEKAPKPPAKKKAINPQTADDDSDDLGKMMEEEVNFGTGGDETENTF